MASFSIIVSNKKRKDNKYPVSIRVYHNYKAGTIPTGLYVSEKQLTKDLRLKDPFLLRELNNKMARYEELKIGLNLDAFSAKELAEYFIRKTTAKTGISIIEYSEGYIEKLIKKGKNGPAANIKTAMNSIMKFSGKEDILFSDITVKFLREYEEWLLNNGSKGRAVSLYIGITRMLFNQARLEYNDDDKGDIQIPNYPFNKYKISKDPVTEKRALTIEQIRSIRDYKPEMVRDEIARDMFMLSFYLVGMNSVDLFLCPPAKNGRITYNRKKTKDRRSDKAEISIKIEPEAQKIIEKYSDNKRLLDLYRRYSTPNNLNAALNKGLKTIGETLGIEQLTFYSARHSWATIALNNAHIDKYTVHTALNHVDESMRVTDIYIKKDWSIIDHANRKVLDLI